MYIYIHIYIYTCIYIWFVRPPEEVTGFRVQSLPRVRGSEFTEMGVLAI